MSKEIYFLEIKADAPRQYKDLFYFTSGKVETVFGKDFPFYHCFGVEMKTIYLDGGHKEIPTRFVKKLVPIDDEFVARFTGVKGKRFSHIYQTLKRNL